MEMCVTVFRGQQAAVVTVVTGNPGGDGHASRCVSVQSHLRAHTNN